jgi:hypothetical protein
LARVDLLPAPHWLKVQCGQEEGWCGWLVSELELGWPNLFLHATEGAAETVARGLLPHIEPPGT